MGFLDLRSEQRIFEIGGVRVGGRPGELPTVLIGSIFYHGHGIVEDHRRGIFDQERAERLIRRQEELSERTGNPCMVDVVGETGEAIKRYIAFVAEVTDAPILINGPTVAVRLEAAEYVREIGLSERAVYNSINFTIGEDEVAAIKDSGLTAAIVQAFNPRNPWPEAMIEVLRGSEGREGLLSIASRAGIEKPLILTPVLDIPHIGCSARGIRMAKEEFSLPTGTAPVGVIGQWRNIEDYGPYARKISRVGATALTQAMGADFLIYGSLAKAATIFPPCALVDAMIAYDTRARGINILAKDHPLYKIFQK